MGARRGPACREGLEGGGKGPSHIWALKPKVCPEGAQQVALPLWKEGCVWGVEGD